MGSVHIWRSSITGRCFDSIVIQCSAAWLAENVVGFNYSNKFILCLNILVFVWVVLQHKEVIYVSIHLRVEWQPQTGRWSLGWPLLYGPMSFNWSRKVGGGIKTFVVAFYEGAFTEVDAFGWWWCFTRMVNNNIDWLKLFL